RAVRDDLPGAVARSQISPRAIVRLVDQYLRSTEPATHAHALLRRRLYSLLVPAVMLDDMDSLSQFLRDGYASTFSESLGRQELVDQMLQVLLESCTLVQMPVVVAFDNFERLLAPQGLFNAELAHSFFRNVAQVIDTTRGLFIMLLAETTLW